MSVTLYNTLTRSKSAFDEEDPIGIYTCGPTVYLDPHIGNWRTFIFYDVLVRVLTLEGNDVRHVLNITDVGHLVSDGDTGEDKMTKTAKQQRKTAWEVAKHYTQLFLDGMQQLNIRKPTTLSKATDHIPEQIAMIQAIEKNGFTYTIDDGVYFDTSKLDDYGKLAGGVKADEDFARINQNDQKRNPEDFALWKFSPEGEQRDMEWESPWGVGFPGWHIECSAMAQKYLGDTIDIHAGGVDHIPVHHTNEIAQSEAASGKLFSKYWLHAEFMKVDGAKMSKSKGNFYTLADIAEKGFEALDFRMLVVQGHYRTETNFTWEILEAARNRRRNLLAIAERRWQPRDESGKPEVFTQAQEQFKAALQDDLNTPKALEALNPVASRAGDGVSRDEAQAFIELLQTVDKALGLALLDNTPDITDEQKKLIEARDAAKAAKDFEKADNLRDQLKSEGLELLDRPGGSLWQRTVVS